VRGRRKEEAVSPPVIPFDQYDLSEKLVRNNNIDR
jgi:hypothetical protein